MFEEFGFDYRIVIGVIAIAWLINYVIAPFLFWRIYRRKHTQGGKANMGRAALLIILAVIALVAWVGKRVAGGLSGKKYDNTISGEIDATFEKTADRVHGLNAKWEVAKKRAVERVEKKTTEKVGQNLQEDEKSPQEIEDKAAQLSPTNSDQYAKLNEAHRRPSIIARWIGERRRKKAIHIAREERRRNREARIEKQE